MITTLFTFVEKTEIIEAMDASEALDKLGIENHFKYENVTKVEEVKK